MKSFKLEKEVSIKQYLITGIVGLIIGIIFYGSVIGSLLIMVSLGSFGMASYIAGKKRKPQSLMLKFLGIFLLGILSLFIILMFVGFFQGLSQGLSN